MFGRCSSRRQHAVLLGDAQPFPTRQMFVLALCRICEPIAFMSIFPYIYFMVASFKITADDRQIAVYAGMVTSAFAFAEFSTGVLWGRLSDKVGRKPVLLTGLAGTGISMLVFGFAPNLWVALFGRALGGLLNGNIGVLQTTVAEVVKVKEHEPRAFSIMPFIWCLGSIIGSGIGGALAEPVKNYPAYFARGTVFDRFPFLLPNLICAFVVLCGLVVGILFLEETHDRMKHRRDYGLEAGSWLAKTFTSKMGAFSASLKTEKAGFEETAALIEGDLPSGFTSTTSTPRLSSTNCNETVIPDSTLTLDEETPLPKPRKEPRSIFTRQILFCVAAYGILAYHTISFEQLMPVLLSMEEAQEKPILPFKFTGGYGLPSSTVGVILSLQGIYQMAAQLLLFPYVVRRFGRLATFRAAALTYPLLHFITPYLTLLPDHLRMPGVCFILIWKVTHQSLAFPALSLVITNSAPSRLVLGTINGVAASAASLSRAIGPTVSGLIQSVGLGIGYSGIAWWAAAAVAAGGAVECLYIQDPAEAGEVLVTPSAAALRDEMGAIREFAFPEKQSFESDATVTSRSTLVDEEGVQEMEKIQIIAKY